MPKENIQGVLLSRTPFLSVIFHHFLPHLRIEFPISDHCYLPFERLVAFLAVFRVFDVWGFQDLWDFHEVRMVHDVHEWLKANLAKPKVLVSVFSRSRFVLAVVHMEHGYLIFADESVELLHDSIEIMYDVVARIAGVTSVKAHTS